MPATATSALLVLVIDDHRDSVEGLQLLLEQCGHKVLIAYDGRSGLDIATAEHPDLVICDLGLPTVDGYAVATELRRNPATADIVLFALSGYGDHDTIQRAADVGFDRHLIKPVDPAALLELLAGLGSA